MNISVPDAGVRDGGREEIKTIEFKIEMPGGSSQSVSMDQGQTIEYVRAYIHEHFGVPFASSTLEFNGKPMFDPLSLVDLGVTGGSTIVCKVEGGASEGGDM
uniref:Ubiquitin-like domain-containing protein n=1 Tax=Hemiselmis andersenii TaxID=464988 RepID=A0A6T8K276_HEMAN|mmetsp:Transcript_18884/g.43620  ORF Transcript_18884/g.43620 Transcript_18884/m.43620 type:complete len:102 (-) Transcript_18884:65-370(-)